MQLGEVEVDNMKIDIRSDEHILWANNIETDNAYWSWQRSLSSLLRPVFPGHMHPIQRNLLNLVAIIDPGTLEGLRYAYLPDCPNAAAAAAVALLSPSLCLGIHRHTRIQRLALWLPAATTLFGSIRTVALLR